MVRDFWQQGFDSQYVSNSRAFTRIRSNPLDSTLVMETFRRRLKSVRLGADPNTDKRAVRHTF
jgi:hypothetical protein